MGKNIYSDETPKVIGKNIRKLRLAYDRSQTDFAKFLGYKNNSGLGFIELGKGSMHLDKLLKACNYFGVTFEQLCNPDLKVTRNITIDAKVEG